MSIKERFNFRTIITFAAISLFAGSTFCFFSPAEIYTADPSEFIIGVSEALVPMLSLSKKNNVIVFLTDRLDGNWMQEALDRYPELYDTFDGFTFYRNNISRNTNTYPSVPEMLSGLDYADLSQTDFIEKIWEENRLLKPLHDKGYRVNLLIDRFMYKNLEDVESYGFVDNIRRQNMEYHIDNLGELGYADTAENIYDQNDAVCSEAVLCHKSFFRLRQQFYSHRHKRSGPVIGRR